MLTSGDSSNYLSAASAAGLALEPPYPSDGSAERVRHLSGGTLSRGTTQAVLQKMDSGELDTELKRRAAKEGERRTSQLSPVGSRDAEGDAAGAAKKPGFDRTQSWNQQDVKRVMSEKLMSDEQGSGDGVGYSSKG